MRILEQFYRSYKIHCFPSEWYLCVGLLTTEYKNYKKSLISHRVILKISKLDEDTSSTSAASVSNTGIE